MSVAKFSAALALGALALVAVFYISDDATNFMAEAVPKASADGDLEDLPEDPDSFVAVAMSKAKKSKFDPFHVYKWTMDEAAKKAPSAKFQAAKKECRLLRTGSYKKCGTFYCSAKKDCGTPCTKKYGEPAKQIVPLAEGASTKFYHVHEVDVKEVHAKEKRAKEVAAKERASKERARKEKAYKEKVAKEKAKKEREKKERVAKEKVTKEKQAKERKTKELNEKKKEAAHKAQVLLKCVDKSDKVEDQCEIKKVAEAQNKELAKEGAAKKAQKVAEAAQKGETADAARYASMSMASGATPGMYASALAKEQGHVAHLMATYSSAASAYNYASSAAITDATTAADAGAAYASEQAVSAGYDVKIAAYTSAVKAAGQNMEETTLPPPTLDPTEAAANTDAQAYANEVIPAGGQRRLLQTGSAAGSSGGAPANAFDPAAAQAEIDHLKAEIATDKKNQAADRTNSATAVNTTSTADQALSNAQDTFNTAHADFKDADNRARLHAGHAQLSQSKTTAVDSYVGTHRGKLHETTCAEEKKFAFDVCFGRASYKGQLFETKAAKDARAEADKYKAAMGKDYAIVIAANHTLFMAESKEKIAENKVRADNERLDKDSQKEAMVKGELKEEKGAKAAKKAAEAKAAAEEAAQKAMAAAAPPPAAEPEPAAETATPTAAATPTPTEAPSAAPTPAPTVHPCDDGTHGCDSGPGGICEKVGSSFQCSCATGYTCSAGCSGPDRKVGASHTCELTPAPTMAPTQPPPVLGSCLCSVTMWHTGGFKDKCQTETTPLGGPEHDQWRPNKSCRDDVNSISMSAGCDWVNIIDDDDGSWGKHRQDVPMHGNMADLPNDVEDDVWGLDIYPKQTCCVANCPTEEEATAELIDDSTEDDEDMELMVNDDDEEDLVTEGDFQEMVEAPVVARRLLAKTDKKPECKKSTMKAYGTCKNVVNDAYAGCTRLYQKAMGQ